MDSFLPKFSIQNFLRQFFCGVVFFIPFLLHATSHCNCFLCENATAYEVTQNSLRIQHGAPLAWDAGKLVVVGICSCIIGTIIYHLEKNLYSYCVQGLFELFHKHISLKSKSSGIFSLVIFEILLFLCVLWFHSILALIIAVLIFVFFGLLLTNGLSLVIQRTQQCWFIEEELKKNSATKEQKEKVELLPDLQMSHAIARKVSTWSDFIHCVQSCCFAWIAGSCFVLKNDANANVQDGLTVAVMLLLLEIVFDYHRYQHVIRMTDLTISIPNSK